MCDECTNPTKAMGKFLAKTSHTEAEIERARWLLARIPDGPERQRLAARLASHLVGLADSKLDTMDRTPDHKRRGTTMARQNTREEVEAVLKGMLERLDGISKRLDDLMEAKGFTKSAWDDVPAVTEIRWDVVSFEPGETQSPKDAQRRSKRFASDYGVPLPLPEAGVIGKADSIEIIDPHDKSFVARARRLRKEYEGSS